MRTKSIASIGLFIAFLFFALWIINKQEREKEAFYKSPFIGKVVRAEQGHKGYFNIRILNKDSLGSFSLTYNDSSIRVYSGDSVYKKANSNIIYVKNYEDSVYTALKLDAVH
jgi:hypothetical protein